MNTRHIAPDAAIDEIIGAALKSPARTLYLARKAAERMHDGDDTAAIIWERLVDELPRATVSRWYDELADAGR